MKALQQIRALTPEQKAQLRDKRIAGEHTLGEWNALLGGLFEFDRSADKARRNSLFAGIGGAVLGFAWAPLWLVSAGAAAYWFKTRKLDLHNDVRDAVLRMIAALQADIDPHQRVRMQLDLRGASPDKSVPGAPPTLRGGWQVTETRVADRWAEGSTLLADGSRLRWRMTTITVLRTKSRSGKTKLKEKRKHRIDVRLGFPLRRYRATGVVPDLLPGERVAVQPGARRIAVRLQRTLATADFEPWSLTSLIARGFEQVEPGKEVRP